MDKKATNIARRIYINIPPKNSQIYHYCPNKVHTSKYTWLTFLPKSIIEQFYGLANFYFLILIILQVFPTFKEVSVVVTALPVVVIVSLTSIKDGLEDLKRHRSDNQVNSAKTYSLFGWENKNHQDPKCESKWKKAGLKAEPLLSTDYLDKKDGDLPADSKVCWKECNWEDIRVGDFIFLRNNDSIPADIIIVSTSETNSTCYVETKNLDGETNLKIKKGMNELTNAKTAAACSSISGYVDIELPNPNLYTFNGSMKLTNSSEADNSATIPIGPSGVLLRGCIIRNTAWLIGIVVYTGAESKIMMNSGPTPTKRSKIERQLNVQVIMNTVILIAMCLICGLAASAYDASLNFEQPIYYSVNGQGLDPPFLTGFIAFFRSLIFYQNIIPIALYISLQMIKMTQAYFIYSDVEIYDPDLDSRALPKAWNLSDDLGQIEYIFSDKTGTLTSNIMDFKRASIDGIVYGHAVDGSVSAAIRKDDYTKMVQKLSTLCNTKYFDKNPGFSDSYLADHLIENGIQGTQIRAFFTLLAVCHTVLVEKCDPGDSNRINYRAQSPDEAALVSAAKNVGFACLSRTENKIEVDILGEGRVYTVLNVLEFNSDRKRMSVIVQKPEGGIMLLCKGADSVIYARLSKENSTHILDDTSDHLQVFASEGLRTLCLAYRNISNEEYTEWNSKYRVAQAVIFDREKECDRVADEIEKELLLLGATAIEDKLQHGVPESIAQLSKAGVKLWVLTGDKVETAINIGFSCNLLKKSMVLIIIQATTPEECLIQLKEALSRFWDKNGQPKVPKTFALVIDGGSLTFGLEYPCKKLLLEIGCRCKSVLCCRVSPLQKALVVRLVREGLGAMCLAIGDGANDVSMIQEADIGVGISGKEGLQAVMASDYAIGQFRFLTPLLLKHGRWSYMRSAEVVLTYFYKNVVWLFILFWHQFYCQFSSGIALDFTYSIYFNTVFTFLPTMTVGMFDMDIDGPLSLKIPQLYLRGIQQQVYSVQKYFMYLAHAIYQSLICYFGAVFLMGEVATRNGYPNDLTSMGTVISFTAILVVNVFIITNWYSWSWITLGSFLFSLVTWVGYVCLYSLDSTSLTTGVIPFLASPLFWFNLAILLLLNFLPRVVIKYLQVQLYPTDTDLVQELQKLKQSPERESVNQMSFVESLGAGSDGKSQASFNMIQSIKSEAHKPEHEHITIDTTDKLPTEGRQRSSSRNSGIILGFKKVVKKLKGEKKFQLRERGVSMVYMNGGECKANTGYAFSHDAGMEDIITPKVSFPPILEEPELEVKPTTEPLRFRHLSKSIQGVFRFRTKSANPHPPEHHGHHDKKHPEEDKKISSRSEESLKPKGKEEKKHKHKEEKKKGAQNDPAFKSAPRLEDPPALILKDLESHDKKKTQAISPGSIPGSGMGSSTYDQSPISDAYLSSPDSHQMGSLTHLGLPRADTSPASYSLESPREEEIPKTETHQSSPELKLTGDQSFALQTLEKPIIIISSPDSDQKDDPGNSEKPKSESQDTSPSADQKEFS